VQSSFGHAILFGSALAMTLPLLLYLISISKSNARKVLLWGIAALMFLNLYKTTSRGPWLAATSALILTLLLGNRRMRQAVLVICLLSATVLIVRPGVWTSITNLYGATMHSDSAQGQSYQWRYALYDIAFQHLNTDWRRALVGYGPESFYYLGWHGNFQGDFVPFESCDSSVAALMIETGYVGLFLVAFLLFKSVMIGYQYARKRKQPDNLLCMALVISILMFCFMMTNVLIMGWGQQSYMFWIILALTVTYPRIAEGIAPSPAISKRPLHERSQQPRLLQRRVYQIH
jgi:O-antigen ligase